MNTKILLAVMTATVLTIGYFFGPWRSSGTEKVQEEVVFESDESVEPSQLAGTVRQLEDGSRIEVSEDGRTRKLTFTDGSEITTSSDGFGNSTESKFFVDNPKVKGVMVVASADGTKTVRVYAANGAVVTLESGILRDPINATASELANAAGIFDEDRPGPPPKPVELTDEAADPPAADDAKADGK